MNNLSLSEFENFLRSKSLTQEKYIPYYVYWASIKYKLKIIIFMLLCDLWLLIIRTYLQNPADSILLI